MHHRLTAPRERSHWSRLDYLVMCTNRLEALDHAVPIRRRKIESLTDELLVEYGIAGAQVYLLSLADTKAHPELRRKALDRDSQLTAPGSSIPGEPMAGRAERSADAEGPYETKNCGSRTPKSELNALTAQDLTARR